MLTNRILGKIYEPKREKVTVNWRKFYNEELHNFCTFRYILVDNLIEDKVRGAYGTPRRNEECILSFEWKISWRGATLKPQHRWEDDVKMGRTL
jgi:hypothetical protein